MTRQKYPPVCVKVAIACCRALLYLHPPAYRHKMGDALVCTFEDDFYETYECEGSLALVSLFGRVILDLFVTGSAEWHEHIHSRTKGVQFWKLTLLVIGFCIKDKMLRRKLSMMMIFIGSGGLLMGWLNPTAPWPVWIWAVLYISLSLLGVWLGIIGKLFFELITGT